MTKKLSEYVSRFVGAVIIAAVVFCALVALLFPPVQKPYTQTHEAAWSDGWRTAQGETLTLPYAKDTKGETLTVLKTLPDTLQGDALLVFSTDYLPVTAAVDGQALTVTGTFLNNPLGFVYANANSIIQIPQSAAGKTVSVTLRPDGCKYRMELYQVRLGSCAQIKAAFLSEGESANLLGMILVIVSVALMALSGLLRFSPIKEHNAELNWVALFIFFSALWFITDCGANSIRYGHNPAYLCLNVVVYLSFGLPFELLMLKLCPTGRRWIFGMAVISALQILAVIGLALVGVYHLATLLTVSHVIYVLTIVIGTVCTAVEVFSKKNRNLVGLFIGMIVLMLTGAATIYHYYFLCSMDNASYFRTGVVFFAVGLTIWALGQTSDSVVKARTYQELRYAATHDELTGLYNKAAFYKGVQALLASDKARVFAICCFDIQRFRVVNEVAGRETGDELLRFIGRRLIDRVEGLGIYARLESDKFLMCIPYNESCLHTLCDALQKDVSGFETGVRLTLDFGWAIITDRSLPMETLVDRAASARLLVKGQYMSHLAFYNEGMRLMELEEQGMIHDAEAAIENRQFQMYLQAKYSLQTEKAEGFEALVRWERKGEILSPASFIPLFERSGLILRVDEYVWRCACQTLRRWIDRYGMEKTLPISVNVSRNDIYSPNLSSMILAILAEYRIPPRLIQLEITETACADDLVQLTQLMALFRSQGFSVHMDDFGSGYSSLNMLRDVAVDAIKIDMRFLDDVEHSKKSRGILKAVVDMANALGIRMIAEGVETKNQADMLREMGCQSAQGYYYSRPVPVNEAEKLIG